MKIQVLGTGCQKCTSLAASVEAVAVELGIDFELEKITDINQIMAFGVMLTPALALDGEVKVVGKVPSPNELKKLLQQ
ncbi:MAG: TM0996/MTH895 family glutaredoxin-like protein [Deltaproteobacteria bacterium]|nr:TM0996/MTH895 family glutaredoxin-like protein [Deltaproteobacteria bacterium]